MLEPEGIELPDLDSPYPAAFEAHAEQDLVDTEAKRAWRMVGAPSAGDVLLFRAPDGRWLHVGVSLGMGEMVHARPRLGVVIERVEPIWARLMLGTYRHRSRCTS